MITNRHNNARRICEQLAAAKAEIAISPMGEKSIGSIPESPSAPLTPPSPDQQHEVYQRAVGTAPDGKVSYRVSHFLSHLAIWSYKQPKSTLTHSDF